MKKKILAMGFIALTLGSVGYAKFLSIQPKDKDAGIMLSNIEALSRGEGGEQACVEANDICVFHGLLIANSKNY